MAVVFPLSGIDGWYPGDDHCAVCRKSILKPPQRVRVYFGAASEHKFPSDASSCFNVFWYRGASLSEPHDDIRGVFVIPKNDDPEACIELCSVECLQKMFDEIIRALHQPIKWQE